MALFMEVYDTTKMAAVLVNPSTEDMTKETLRIFTEVTEEKENIDSDTALIEEFKRVVEGTK